MANFTSYQNIIERLENAINVHYIGNDPSGFPNEGLTKVVIDHIEQLDKDKELQTIAEATVKLKSDEDDEIVYDVLHSSICSKIIEKQHLKETKKVAIDEDETYFNLESSEYDSDDTDDSEEDNF